MRKIFNRTCPSIFSAALGLLFTLAAGSPGQENIDPIPKLIQGLGHENWHVREKSQEALIALGAKAVRPLIQAAKSGNPEISLRARLILNQVDPLQVRLRIQEIELGDPPKMARILEETGDEGGEILLPNRLDPSRYESRYAVQCHFLGEGDINLNVEEIQPGSSRGIQLHAVSDREGAVSILKRGEKVYYRQIGLHSERTRYPFVTIARWWSERISETLEQGDNRPQGDLSALIRDLSDQAERGDLPVQLEALELLGLLRVPEAKEVFQKARKIPSLELAALMGLARLGDKKALDSLAEITAFQVASSKISSPGSRKARGGGRQKLALQGKSQMTEATVLGKDPELDALLVLAESGYAGAFKRLAERISEIDPVFIHPVLATMAEQIDQAPSSCLDLILEAVSSTEFLSQLNWQDPEIEHFFGVLLENSRISQSEAFIHKLLQGLSSTLGYNATSASGRSRVFARIWQRVPRGNGELLRGLLNQIFEGPANPARLDEAITWLCSCFHLEPMPEDCFQKLLGNIRKILHRPANNAVEDTLIRSGLHKLTRELALTKPQFVELVKLVAEASELVSQPYSLQFIQDLQRLTGIPSSSLRRPPTSTPTEPPVQKVRLKPSSQVALWASDPEKVEASFQGQFPAPATSGGDALEFWEFVRLVTSDAETTNRTRIPGSTPATSSEVLDGLRQNIRAGIPFQRTDRWGNRLTYRIDAERTLNRYRLNGQTFLTIGYPSFASLREKSLRTGQYITSDVQLGTTHIAGSQRERLQALYYIRRVGSIHRGPPDSEEPGQLWKQFLENILEDLKTMNPEKAFQLVRQLDLREAAPFLREKLQGRAFDKTAQYDFPLWVAQWLLERDDPAGKEYLQIELKGTDLKRRFRAAQFLTDRGDRSGLRVLLELLAQNPMAYFSAIPNLDTFLKSCNPTDEEYRQVMDMVVENLHLQNFWYYGFKLISAQAETDFGYEAARRIQPATARKQALERSAEAAKRWWAAQRSSSPGR